MTRWAICVAHERISHAHVALSVFCKHSQITKQDVPEKKGLCSNYLCDSKPGDVLNMTGEGSPRQGEG